LVIEKECIVESSIEIKYTDKIIDKKTARSIDAFKKSIKEQIYSEDKQRFKSISKEFSVYNINYLLERSRNKLAIVLWTVTGLTLCLRLVYPRAVNPAMSKFDTTTIPNFNKKEKGNF